MKSDLIISTDKLKRTVCAFIIAVFVVTAAMPSLCFAKPAADEKTTETAIEETQTQELSGEALEIEYAGEYLKYVMSLINSCYVDDVSIEEILKGAVAGMAGKLDKYTEFLDNDAFKKIMDESNNEYVGIGIAYYEKYDNGYPLITNVYEDSPAEKAGILKDDVLISLDGTDVKDMESKDIIAIISDKKGKTIKAVLKRKEKDIETNIKIDDFVAPTVFVSKLDEVISEGLEKVKADKVRYVQITDFADGTGKEFVKAVKKMKDQNVEAIIIDLRFNGGGVTQSAYEICECLVKEGAFLNIKRKDGKYTVNSEDNNVPFKNIAVLTNEATASASELVAGVLKDNGAVVVGGKTYGKGVTQAIIELQNLGALKITSEEFFPMSGRKINGVGITPDYEVNQIKLITTESENIEKDVEEALKALDINIETNEKKAAAISVLQKIYGIKETGQIDSATISALNNEIVNRNYINDNVLSKAIEVVFSKM